VQERDVGGGAGGGAPPTSAQNSGGAKEGSVQAAARRMPVPSGVSAAAVERRAGRGRPMREPHDGLEVRAGRGGRRGGYAAGSGRGAPANSAADSASAGSAPVKRRSVASPQSPEVPGAHSAERGGVVTLRTRPDFQLTLQGTPLRVTLEACVKGDDAFESIKMRCVAPDSVAERV